MDTHGKTIVITGAASGIGQALAELLAGQQARLMLADIRDEKLQALADALRAKGARCETRVTDTGQESELHALAALTLELLGPADIVINNAGVALVATAEQASTADAHWLMNINFWGVVHGCRAFLPQLRQRPGALLVNISSIFAMISMPSQGWYNAAKAGVRAFSDALREELRDTPVRVLCVHPGGIKTNIANHARVVSLEGIAENIEAMHRQFNEVAAITTAQAAAEQIVHAIHTDRTRLLIGRDARVADWLFRLFPARASHWISSMARRRAAKGP